MTCTVLGASGFIGSRLAKALRDAGHAVFTPSRNDPLLFEQNLGQVFYCVGLTADYAQRPFDTVEAHVGLLSEILQNAQFDRLIYLSSTRLYDSASEAYSAESDNLSLSPGNPRHLYDLSKALGENLCLNYSQERAAVARLASVYDTQAGSPGFLSHWLSRMATERVMLLDSSPNVVRDYIRVDDVVGSLRAMMDMQAQGVVNVASGENVSNRELAECMAQKGWSVSFSRESAPQAFPVCSVDRLEELGVRPVKARQFIETYMERLQARCD